MTAFGKVSHLLHTVERVMNSSIGRIFSTRSLCPVQHNGTVKTSCMSDIIEEMRSIDFPSKTTSSGLGVDGRMSEK